MIKKHLNFSDVNLNPNLKYFHFKFLAVSQSWVNVGVVIPNPYYVIWIRQSKIQSLVSVDINLLCSAQVSSVSDF